MNDIVYRTIEENEITRELFGGFVRRQEVTKCWRRDGGEWVIRDDPFVDDWSEEDYQILVRCLKNTVKTGGFVCGAFCGGVLKGFVSLEAEIFGGENKYLDLTSLHVSADMRRRGIGGELFRRACRCAARLGAKKLYISSHSAAETQGFYRGLGCIDAAECSQMHVEAEPFDCQLEFTLNLLNF